MLPNVVTEDGEQALRDWVVLVGRGNYLHVAAALARQPHPAASELFNACVVELSLEILEGPESFLDHVRDRTARISTAFRLHDFPEHRVIDVAATVVTDGGANVFRYCVQVANQILGAL